METDGQLINDEQIVAEAVQAFNAPINSEQIVAEEEFNAPINSEQTVAGTVQAFNALNAASVNAFMVDLENDLGINDQQRSTPTQPSSSKDANFLSLQEHVAEKSDDYNSTDSDYPESDEDYDEVDTGSRNETSSLACRTSRSCYDPCESVIKLKNREFHGGGDRRVHFCRKFLCKNCDKNFVGYPELFNHYKGSPDCFSKINCSSCRLLIEAENGEKFNRHVTCISQTKKYKGTEIKHEDNDRTFYPHSYIASVKSDRGSQAIWVLRPKCDPKQILFDVPNIFSHVYNCDVCKTSRAEKRCEGCCCGDLKSFRKHVMRMVSESITQKDFLEGTIYPCEESTKLSDGSAKEGVYDFTCTGCGTQFFNPKNIASHFCDSEECRLKLGCLKCLRAIINAKNKRSAVADHMRDVRKKKEDEQKQSVKRIKFA